MKFNNSILVIGSLGEIKAYRVVEKSGMDRHESSQVSHAQHHGTEKEATVLELVTDIDYIGPRKSVEDLKSDQAGLFGGRLGHSMEEAHNTELEEEKRTLKEISEDIKTLIEKEAPSSWYLSFPKDKHLELEAILSADIKKTLKKVVPSNLTKTEKEKLLSHFE